MEKEERDGILILFEAQAVTDCGLGNCILSTPNHPLNAQNHKSGDFFRLGMCIIVIKLQSNYKSDVHIMGARMKFLDIYRIRL